MRRIVALTVLALTVAVVPVRDPAAGPTARAQTTPRDPVVRLAGDDRVDTAVALAQDGWPSADAVLLASAAAYPDALSGGALAAAMDAPLLLTDPASLSAATAAEIARLDPETVTVLGGPAAVSAGVDAVLRQVGVAVERLAGPDRYATAAAIAARLGPVDEVALASGAGFADALAAGALAAADGTPTLLTAPETLTAVTAAALGELGVRRVLLLGGQQAVGDSVQDAVVARGVDVERLAGADRYETGALASGEALSRIDVELLPVVAATGENFPDALAAAAYAARRDALLVVVPGGAPDQLAPQVARLLALAGPRLASGVLVGGPQAIADAGTLDGITAAPVTRTAVADGPPGSAAAATVEPFATRAALEVLADGGNAVDATVAAAGVLGVTEPFSAGIGGGGFMVIALADQRVVTVDSREQAPVAYFPEVFLNESGTAIPFPERVTSGLGVGVPGTVAGWDLALTQFGTRSLAELLDPAITFADYGFPLDATFSQQVTDNAARFRAFSSTAELYLTETGTAPAAFSWFRNPDLAQTYRAIAGDGPAGFYGGPVAQALVDTVAAPPVVADETRTVRPGLVELADLSAYRALLREPVAAGYRGYEVYGMGPPSSGGATIALALNQLERFEPLGTREQALHRYLESIHLAWADRNAYLADPAFVDVPLEGLLRQAYADARSAGISETATVTVVPPGTPESFTAAPGAEVARLGSTTHVTVSDAAGNVVAYTFTIEQTGGSGIVVPGHGFLLNNELTDFNATGPSPNLPAAGKRPRSSMSPTIVLRDGEVVLAYGSPGGATIITTVLQGLVDVLDLGSSLPEAVAAPRVGNFNAEASTAEAAFLATPEAAALLVRGHRFTSVAEIGAATGIAFGADGSVTAAAEPVRRGGGDAGVTVPMVPAVP